MRKFYDRGRDGVPRDWVEMVLQAWSSLGPDVTAARMVRDYTTALYEPAAASAIHLVVERRQAGRRAGRVARARRRVVGRRRRHVGRRRRHRRRRPAPPAPSSSTVALGGLTPADVRVEVVHGSLGHDGEFLSDVTIAELQPDGPDTYAGEIKIGIAGSYGVSARVVPVHPDLASPFDVGTIAWAVDPLPARAGRPEAGQRPVNVALPGPCSRKLATPVTAVVGAERLDERRPLGGQAVGERHRQAGVDDLLRQRLRRPAVRGRPRRPARAPASAGPRRRPRRRARCAAPPRP